MVLILSSGAIIGLIIWLSNIFFSSKNKKRKTYHEGKSGKGYISTIAGVTFKTADGKDRQSYIKSKLIIGDNLFFKHEPENPYDPDAIAIHASNGFHLGYVKRGLFFGGDGESLILKTMSTGKQVTGKVIDKRKTDDGALGVVYEIFV